jgi:hypothetical protein
MNKQYIQHSLQDAFAHPPQQTYSYYFFIFPPSYEMNKTVFYHMIFFNSVSHFQYIKIHIFFTTRADTQVCLLCPIFLQIEHLRRPFFDLLPVDVTGLQSSFIILAKLPLLSRLLKATLLSILNLLINKKNHILYNKFPVQINLNKSTIT